MSPEYVAGLFGLIGTVIGAIVGAYASIFSTRSELAVSFKQMKLATFRERIEALQRTLSQISSIKVNIPRGKLTDEEFIRAQLPAFRERVAIFLAVAHYFTREEEESVRDVIQRLDSITSNIITGRQTTNEERVGIIREAEACDKQISTLLKEKLRHEHYQISQLIDKK